jgi:LPS-assembly protein
MTFRFFALICLLITTQLALGEGNVWDCEQNKDGEWVCNSKDSVEPIQTELPPELVPAAESAALVVEGPPTRPKPVFIQPPATVAKRPGWTCNPSEENETWNCSLIGVDPKGKAKVVERSDHQMAWFTPTYDFAEEEIFKTLQNEFPQDPWQNCGSPSASKYVSNVDQSLRETLPMDVNADYSEVFDKEITSFSGNVEIKRADQHMMSDMASYDSVSQTLDAQGHVFYSEDQISLYSETAMLNMASDEARLRNALFVSPSGPIRGRADVVYRDSKALSRYNEASFTSCPPGNQDWIVHAERLKMNKATGQASAKNAWMEFKGVPVLYTPYISFPIDDRRLSGFLAPSWGSTEKNGFDFEIPYYWNIAPNYDATLTPRYMTKRGGMLRSQLRYLTELSQGELGVEFMPFDSLRNESRYSASIQARSNFTHGVTSNLDLNYVSDDDYFNDLNNALGFSDTRHVRSLADLQYNQDWVSFVARLEHYDTIDRTIAPLNRPYSKFPQIQLNLNHAMDDFPLAVGMDNDYSYFHRSGRITGHRMNVKPYVSFPLETAGAFIQPKFSLQHSEYRLEDQPLGLSEDISRTLPIMSVDSGLFFERDLAIGDSAYLHTLEPRAFYLYIPHTDQSDIPLFDTAEYDFNFNSMFRENRFNGSDRIQDANQVTLALTSRLLDSKTGQERLKMSVGEIFYFQDREVVLTGNTPETHSFSNVVAELSGQLTDHFSFSSAMQWNPDANDITRGQGLLRYRNQPDQIINLGYRYRRDDPSQPASIIQSDVSFRWPIYDNWYAVGRWQYSLKYNQTVESFFGFEKESCCWRFRVLGRRFVNSISETQDAKAENAFFVQLELKGFASFGDKVDDFLDRNLYGYRKPDY